MNEETEPTLPLPAVIPPALPTDESPEEEDDEDYQSPEERRLEIVKANLPRKRGQTRKEALRALKRFTKQTSGMMNFGNLAEFGDWIKGKGTDSVSVGIDIYAAEALKNRIENCERLIEMTENPELKVRLQENVVKLIEQLGKISANLKKNDEPKTKSQPDNRPLNQLQPFPPNVSVAIQTVQNLVHPNDKP